MRGDGIVFRRYEKSDLKRCCEVAVRVWPEVLSMAKSGDAPFAMEAYIDFYRASANWQEVACVSGSVVGILFGKVEGGITRLGRLRGYLSERFVYLKFLAGAYGRIPGRMSMTRKAMSDDRNKLLNSPEADGEVIFFMVDRDHQGKGMGRQLMGRFIDHARGSGARRIIVYTNDPGCNWDFYQKYGFKHYSTFRDNFTSLIRNEEVKGLIFTLDL